MTKIVQDGLTSPSEINALQQAGMLHERAPPLVKPRISCCKTEIRQPVQRIIRLLLMLLRVLVLVLVLPQLRLHMKRGLLEPLRIPRRIRRLVWSKLLSRRSMSRHRPRLLVRSRRRRRVWVHRIAVLSMGRTKDMLVR